MNTSEKRELLTKELENKGGVLRLAPTWVPRAFMVPGGRIKLAPEDLYILGADRGGIDERWFASTTQADNGPGTPEDEGLSYIAIEVDTQVHKVLLREAIELIGNQILGEEMMKEYGDWMILTKFFDNLGPISHHLHQMEEHAKKVGKRAKPESYYFPIQLNFKTNNFPYTFFGLIPGTTKEDIKKCLEDWNKGDNGILYHSRAYKLKPGTGWLVPAGVLHAPGSLVTYEVQRASDVFAMFQSMVEDRPTPRELLVKDVPEDLHYDLDYIISMIDWKENTDPEFAKHHFISPKPIKDEEEMKGEGYMEKWVIYGSENFSAKELAVFPKKSVVIKDASAYGLILLQGRGTIGEFQAETPALIRYGDLTNDEFFVTFERAKEGVKITNTSETEELVMLKHFASEATL